MGVRCRRKAGSSASLGMTESGARRAGGGTRPYTILLLLLLFLLLLGLEVLGWGRRRGAADDHGGGHVFVGGRVGKGDSHRDAEFAFGSAFEYAAGGRDFGIIASNGNANV